MEDVAEVRGASRFSSRSSPSTTSTISDSTVVGYGEHAMVKSASVTRGTSAYVIDRTGNKSPLFPGVPPHAKPPAVPSPLGSHFGSKDGSGTSSAPSGSPSQDRHPTPTETDPPLNYYTGGPYTPSPSRLAFGTKALVHLLVSTSGTFGGVREEEEEEEEEDLDVDQEVLMAEPEVQEYGEGKIVMKVVSPAPQEEVQRPRIVISPTLTLPTTLGTLAPGGITPPTPMPRYRGRLATVVKPLEDFIDDAIGPREYYIDLQEIAEGESGAVFAAQLAPNKDLAKLRLDAGLVAQDQQALASGEPVAIAIKSVAIVRSLTG